MHVIVPHIAFSVYNSTPVVSTDTPGSGVIRYRMILPSVAVHVKFRQIL